jgi:hypothetical protein
VGAYTTTGSVIQLVAGTGTIPDGNFLFISDNSSITFTLPQESRYVGLYAMWLSGGNTFKFYDSNDNLLAQLSSSSIVSLLNSPGGVLADNGQTYPGSQYKAADQTEYSAYINLRLSDPAITFKKIVFTHDQVGGGNELDNVTISATYPVQSYSIGGAVTGLASGQSVVLLNNAGNSTTVNSNTSFTFSTAINSGGAYAVTVGTQPTGQTCTVTSGSGTVSANVTNVIVTCTTNPAQPIPTLGEWAMIFMASLMAMFGIRRMRRSK